MMDASPEVCGLAARLTAAGYVSIVIVSSLVWADGRATRSYMLLHAPPEPRGVAVLCRWRNQSQRNGKLVQTVRKCNEERIHTIKDKIGTNPVDARISRTKARVNIACLLSVLGLSVLCWVFVRASFLQNPKKNLNIYR